MMKSNQNSDMMFRVRAVINVDIAKNIGSLHRIITLSINIIKK